MKPGAGRCGSLVRPVEPLATPAGPKTARPVFCFRGLLPRSGGTMLRHQARLVVNFLPAVLLLAAALLQGVAPQVAAGAPAPQPAPNRLDVFGRGTDNAL